MRPEELESLLVKELDVNRLSRGQNGWFRGCCPLHQESNPSFGIHSGVDSHPYLCFVCGKGTLAYLVKEVKGISRKEAIKLIHKYGDYDEDSYGLVSNSSVIPPEDYASRTRRQKNPSTLAWEGMSGWPLLASFEKKESAMISSMIGLPVSVVNKHRLGFDTNTSRIVYPWIWYDRLVGMTGRTTDPTNPAKTITYFGFQKSEALYAPGERISSNYPLVIVEGEKDALHVFQAHKNVVALGYSNFSWIQARLITDRCSDVRVFPDPDKGGEQFFENVKRRLLGRVQLYRIHAIEDKDPAEHSREELEEILGGPEIVLS